VCNNIVSALEMENVKYHARPRQVRLGSGNTKVRICCRSFLKQMPSWNNFATVLTGERRTVLWIGCSVRRFNLG